MAAQSKAARIKIKGLNVAAWKALKLALTTHAGMDASIAMQTTIAKASEEAQVFMILSPLCWSVI